MEANEAVCLTVVGDASRKHADPDARERECLDELEVADRERSRRKDVVTLEPTEELLALVHAARRG